MRHSARISFGILMLSLAITAMAESTSAPAAPRRPVTDIYQGMAVTDDYRWLEDIHAPDVQAWIDQQNALTQSTLDGFGNRPTIMRELGALIGQAPITRNSLNYVNGKLFALKRQPPSNQPRLVVLEDPADPASEHLILDPNVLNPKGTTAIDWYVPSLDGNTVAVSLSDNGSEEGTLHFFNVSSGNALPDVLPRVQSATAGGSVAWAPGSTGLYYTRYPQGQERAAEDASFYQQVWFHQLGTPAASDHYVIGKRFPRIAEIALSSTENGVYTLADVSNGDGGEHAFYLRGPSKRWTRVADFNDGVRSIELGRDGRWYGVVLKGTPRGRIVAAPLKAPALRNARVIIAQGKDVVAAITPASHRIYVSYLTGGPEELLAFTLKGKWLARIGAEAIARSFVGARLDGDRIFFGSQSFIKPFSWYSYSPSAQNSELEPERISLSEVPQNVALDEFEVRRQYVRSPDGTQVPINIVCRKDLVLDGTHPTILNAYGGYGVSMQPFFSLLNVFWLRHGGIYVLANVRGGGEWGEDWHRAGKLTRKQNVFDDFIASARYLIDHHYTSPAKLAIQGGSNGGLLMGAALVQHPELFKAVVSHVGIYDMLRVELSPNGAFNVTEFGSVQDPAQFAALYAYSPYHHVIDCTRYPAVMLLTGINDGRVEPYNSLKMAARLQAANGSGLPILLRVAGDAGHGQGMALSAAIAQSADVFAFLFYELGMAAPQ